MLFDLATASNQQRLSSIFCEPHGTREQPLCCRLTPTHRTEPEQPVPKYRLTPKQVVPFFFVWIAAL